MKQTIKLNESQLRKIVKESVKKILNEGGFRNYDRENKGGYLTQEGSLKHIQKAVNYLARIEGCTPAGSLEDCLGEVFDVFSKYGIKPFGDRLNESVPSDWKETEFSGVYTDADGALYMPDDNSDEVFTIQAFDIINEDSIDNMRYTAKDYDTEEEAINAARDFARELISDDRVIIVTVFGGEYRRGDDIYGEPQDLYAISNKDEKTTRIARRKANYTSDNVDEYIIH